VEIKKLHQKIGNTIIYVTHDQVEAMTLADRIVVLQAGNLIQYDTPDGVYNRPATRFVAGFTGSPPMNFLPCRIGDGGRVLHLPGAVDLTVPDQLISQCAQHVGRTLTFGLRPEHVSAGAAGGAPSAAVTARVMLVEPLGSDTLGLVKLGGGAEGGEITGRFPPDAKLKVGEHLVVSLQLNRFHLFDPDTGRAIREVDW
jgi:multiple sugar transport system ATP-binding protein